MNKKYEVIWSNTTARDFEHIIEYIAHDSPAML
jgi:plasmid stabilization system protein ParE